MAALIYLLLFGFMVSAADRYFGFSILMIGIGSITLLSFYNLETSVAEFVLGYLPVLGALPRPGYWIAWIAAAAGYFAGVNFFNRVLNRRGMFPENRRHY